MKGTRVKYVKIIHEKPMENRLSQQEDRSSPTSFLDFAEFQESIIRVRFTPGTPDFDEVLFMQNVVKCIKRQRKVVEWVIMDEIRSLG